MPTGVAPVARAPDLRRKRCEREPFFAVSPTDRGCTARVTGCTARLIGFTVRFTDRALSRRRHTAGDQASAPASPSVLRPSHHARRCTVLCVRQPASHAAGAAPHTRGTRRPCDTNRPSCLTHNAPRLSQRLSRYRHDAPRFPHRPFCLTHNAKRPSHRASRCTHDAPHFRHRASRYTHQAPVDTPPSPRTTQDALRAP